MRFGLYYLLSYYYIDPDKHDKSSPDNKQRQRPPDVSKDSFWIVLRRAAVPWSSGRGQPIIIIEAREAEHAALPAVVGQIITIIAENLSTTNR